MTTLPDRRRNYGPEDGHRVVADLDGFGEWLIAIAGIAGLLMAVAVIGGGWRPQLLIELWSLL